MRIEYEGQVYDFEFSDITVKQAIKIEKHLGSPIAEFGDRLQPKDGNPDLLAMQALGWLILHDGRGVPIDDTDFKLMELFGAVAKASAGDAAEEEPEADGPDPTAAASTSPAGIPDGQLTAP